MSADVKANIKQEIKNLVAYLTNVYELPVKLEKQYTKRVYFSFDFLLGIPFVLLSVKSRGKKGGGRGLLNG